MRLNKQAFHKNKVTAREAIYEEKYLRFVIIIVVIDMGIGFNTFARNIFICGEDGSL